jgi:hypothetical protein
LGVDGGLWTMARRTQLDRPSRPSGGNPMDHPDPDPLVLSLLNPTIEAVIGERGQSPIHFDDSLPTTRLTTNTADRLSWLTGRFFSWTGPKTGRLFRRDGLLSVAADALYGCLQLEGRGSVGLAFVGGPRQSEAPRKSSSNSKNRSQALSGPPQ